MPSEERKALALEAVRPRIEQFHSSLTMTTNQVRGMLASSQNTDDDKKEALGQFAKGKVNMDRFNAFTQKAEGLKTSMEAPIRAAEQVLKSMLDEGDDLFTIRVQEGRGLGHSLSVRLASIGRAFAAARVVDLAKNGAYKEDKHAHTLEGFPYAHWNSSERALAPPLLVDSHQAQRRTVEHAGTITGDIDECFTLAHGPAIPRGAVHPFAGLGASA